MYISIIFRCSASAHRKLGPFCSVPHEFYNRDGCITVIVENGRRYNTTLKFTFEMVDFSTMANQNSPSICAAQGCVIMLYTLWCQINGGVGKNGRGLEKFSNFNKRRGPM